MGGLDGPPNPPALGDAPGHPGRPSVTRESGGLEGAPQARQLHARSGGLDGPQDDRRRAHAKLCGAVIRRGMTRDEIVVGLRDLLTRQEQVKVDVWSITENTRLDRIGFDSISILDFIYDVEDRFRIQTEIADLVAMERVSDLIDYLEVRLAG